MDKLLIIGNISQSMVAALQPSFELHHLKQMAKPLAWLRTHGEQFKYLLTNGHDGVKAEYWELLPKLELISNFGVGYDSIDTTIASQRGIIVTHTPGVLDQEVATTALLLLLACYRQLSFNEAHARSRRWQSEGDAPFSRSVDNRCIGIVGLGRIGSAIARKLEPFNASIGYYGRSQKNVAYKYYPDLIELAQDSEALICVTPGGSGTRHLINRAVLEALGPEGVLINVARGSVINETELIAALQSGKLGCAGLDVFEHEPNIPEALLELPNTVLTPHIGSATVETRAAMGQLTVDNLLSYQHKGKVISPIPECNITQ